MIDIRDTIFRDIENRDFKAFATVEGNGYLSGVDEAMKIAEELGVKMTMLKGEGEEIHKGEKIFEIVGKPKQIAISEERIMGSLCKYSGIATAARRAVNLAKGKTRIVCGSVKKMPFEIKVNARKSIESGGAHVRIIDSPMVYLDKNYVAMLGSIKNALESVSEFPELVKVIQLKGSMQSIAKETREAIEYGANLLMVDTGKVEDLEECVLEIEKLKKSDDVQVSFSGSVKIDDIPFLLSKYKIDALCIGREIIDAPLLDMKIDVEY